MSRRNELTRTIAIIGGGVSGILTAFHLVRQTKPAPCVAYLPSLHAAILGGAEWRSAIDSLRETTNKRWLRVPIEEKKRFRRHPQCRWDVVRHRMALSIADFIKSDLRNGTLHIREGHLEAVDASPKGAYVTVRHMKAVRTSMWIGLSTALDRA